MSVAAYQQPCSTCAKHEGSCTIAGMQETCPRGGKHWKGSSTYLSLLGAHRRLAASIRAEHELMRQANLTFRQVPSIVQDAFPAHSHALRVHQMG